MQDISEYINSDFAQRFAQLNLRDQAVVLDSFSVYNPKEEGCSLIKLTLLLLAFTKSER
jgi:hypothetical protein